MREKIQRKRRKKLKKLDNQKEHVFSTKFCNIIALSSQDCLNLANLGICTIKQAKIHTHREKEKENNRILSIDNNNNNNNK